MFANPSFFYSCSENVGVGMIVLLQYHISCRKAIILVNGKNIMDKLQDYVNHMCTQNNMKCKCV